MAGWLGRRQEINSSVIYNDQLPPSQGNRRSLRRTPSHLSAQCRIDRIAWLLAADDEGESGTDHAMPTVSRQSVEVALLFLFSNKRLCGPSPNSRFHHQPDPQHRPDSRLKAAYHRADAAIQKVVDLLAAA
jgi:hypothetical protein